MNNATQIKNTLPYNAGDKYGFIVLTGKDYMAKKGRGTIRHVEYICKCGAIGWTRLESLKNGHTKSCGCAHKESVTTNGISRHPLNNVWEGVIRRCYDPEFRGYHNYGGRGVTVCDEWVNNRMAFYNWAVNNGWEKGLELDKDKLSPFKVGLIYSPEFCCFLTHQENSLHTSRSRVVEYKGETNNLSEWCKKLGLKYGLVLQRIVRQKWSIEKSFETPMGQLIKRK